MRNSDVVNAFLQGRNAKGSNLRSENDKLYSYTSLMAEWVDGNIVVHMPIATYSNTSKHHWYHLRTNAPSNLLRQVD